MKKLNVKLLPSTATAQAQAILDGSAAPETDSLEVIKVLLALAEVQNVELQCFREDEGTVIYNKETLKDALEMEVEVRPLKQQDLEIRPLD